MDFQLASSSLYLNSVFPSTGSFSLTSGNYIYIPSHSVTLLLHPSLSRYLLLSLFDSFFLCYFIINSPHPCPYFFYLNPTLHLHLHLHHLLKLYSAILYHPLILLLFLYMNFFSSKLCNCSPSHLPLSPFRLEWIHFSVFPYIMSFELLKVSLLNKGFLFVIVFFHYKSLLFTLENHIYIS